MLRWIKKQRKISKSNSNMNDKSNKIFCADVDEDPYHVYDEIDDVTDADVSPTDRTDRLYSVAHAVGYTRGIIRQITPSRHPLQEKSSNSMLPNLVQDAVTSRDWQYCPGDDRVTGKTIDDYEEPWYEFDISGMGELSKFLVTPICSKTGNTCSSVGNNENDTWCRKRSLNVFGRSCFSEDIYDVSCHDDSPCLPVRNGNIKVSEHPNRSLQFSAPGITRSNSLSFRSSDQCTRSTSSDSRRFSTSSASSGYDECLSSESIPSAVAQLKTSLFRDSISRTAAHVNRQTSLHNHFISSEITQSEIHPTLSNYSFPCDVTKTKKEIILSNDSISPNVTQFETQPSLSRDCFSNNVANSKRQQSFSRLSLNNFASQTTKRQHLLSRRLINETNPRVCSEKYVYPRRQESLTISAGCQKMSGSEITQAGFNISAGYGRTIETQMKRERTTSLSRASSNSLPHSNTSWQCTGTRASVARPPMWANSKNKLLTDLITSNYDSQMSVRLR